MGFATSYVTPSAAYVMVAKAPAPADNHPIFLVSPIAHTAPGTGSVTFMPWSVNGSE